MIEYSEQHDTILNEPDVSSTHKTGTYHISTVEQDNGSSEAESLALSAGERKVPRNQAAPVRTTIWNATALRWSPLLGLSCLVFVFLTIPAAAVILHIADGAPAGNWKISPTVWLVAFTAIGNKALAFAALQGAIITWWLRALHGSTIERLHRDWSHGAGAELWSILRAGRKTGILAITTLATNVILVDGILLQRAINVVQQPADQLVTLSGPLTTPEVPTNFTGGEIVSPGEGQHWEMPNVLLAGRTAYGPVYRDFVTGSPINATNVECPGLCQTTLRAPAMMQTECREVLTGRINLTDVMSTETWPPICFVRIGGIVFNNTGMKVCPSLALRTWPTAGNSWEGLTVYYGTTDEGISRKTSGNLTVMTCDFRPAVADYSAFLNRNGSIDVDYAKPAFVAWANNTSNFVGRTDVEQEINSTLAGIARTLQVLYDQVSALAIMTQNGETVITYRQPTQFSESLVINGEDLDSSQEHLPLYQQPFDKLRAAMNEIVFRTSIHARKSFDDDTLLSWMDPGLTLPLTLGAKRVDVIPKHIINWWFFWGAAILQMICIALVARMYWGSWSLGRSVSFCPLEIAKAFDAPLLRDVPSNMTGEEIAEKSRCAMGTSMTLSSTQILRSGNGGCCSMIRRGCIVR